MQILIHEFLMENSPNIFFIKKGGNKELERSIPKCK